MTRTALLKSVTAAALLGAAAWAWFTLWPADERAIRRQLTRLVDTVNEHLPDEAAGLGNMTRAAQVGSFFTEDVVVDLGQGVVPMHGRETVIAMAARLPSGAASYRLRFDDVTVNVDPQTRVAEVKLAATLTARSEPSGEHTLDAREFRMAMRKSDNVWRITHVAAVDALRRQ